MTKYCDGERSRGSSVGIATGYGMDGLCSIPGSARFLSSPERPDQPWGPPSLLPIQWVPGALSPGVKRKGREAGHSPPSSAEVKNGGAIPPVPNMPSWRCV
jgi:hypothetical protein